MAPLTERPAGVAEWHTLLSVVAGIAPIYLALMVRLWRYTRTHPETITAREALRLP